MPAIGDVRVTLHGQDGTATVRVPLNKHGQAPSLLINPRDENGKQASGVWLATLGADAELTADYELLTTN